MLADPRQMHRLSELAQSHLRHQLKVLWKPKYSLHDVRVGRLAVTFRHRDRHRDLSRLGFIPLDDLRMEVLSYRWVCDSRGEPRPRVPFACYGAQPEFGGTGRIVFKPIHVRDGSRKSFADEDPIRASATLRLHLDCEIAQAEEPQTDLFLPSFYFAFEPSWRPTFSTTDELEWDEMACEIEGLRAWPQELVLAHFAPTVGSGGFSCPKPKAIYAHIGRLGLASIRNPACDILIRHGLISARERGCDARVMEDYERGSAAATELQRAISTLADDYARECAVRFELAVACESIQHTLIGGAWGDAATDLISNPWRPVTAPNSTATQAILLGGPGYETDAIFSGPTAEADLGSLKSFGAPYRELPRRVVASALNRNRDRKANCGAAGLN